MKDIILAIIFALIILGVFSLNAFLIYTGSSGWGWFLVFSLIIGGLRFKT